MLIFLFLFFSLFFSSTRTPLMLACWHGSLKTVMRLLACNADPMARDRHLCTALHVASWKVPFPFPFF